MIIRFLSHDFRKASNTEEGSFLKEFGRASLEIGVRSAVETIEIISAASEGHHLMLTTWWFLLYYGQYLASSHFFTTNRSAVFSSALVVFAAMVIKHKNGLQVSGFEHSEFTNSLQQALDALENLGDDTRIARRCRKYLKKLLQVASTISPYPCMILTGRKLLTQLASIGTPPRVNLGADQNARHGIVDGMTLPISDPSEFSPMDMDLGPFLAGSDWDVFTHSLEQDYLGLPFQEETM